ncbi:MAG: multidrug effflux MFS transporter [Desulfovibrionales bacterium]
MRGWIAVLALLTAFPPLSIDMILPALPALARTWAEPFSRVNLVLISFFLTYAVSLLVYGPLSDRYGRRRPLMLGLAVYIISSIGSGFSENLPVLVAFRMLQAAGAAAASSMAMAMSKDLFSGKEREQVLATIGIIMALAPMLAPTLGGWTLAFLSWRWIFYTQAAIGVFAMLGVVFMPETNTTRSAVSLPRAAHAYARLLCNAPYMLLTLLMAACLFPLYGYIAVSSEIFINGFGLSEQTFGYFFAFTALCLMAGSFGCLRLVKTFDSTTLITLGFSGAILGSIGLLAGLGHGPWGFALPMAMIAFSCGLSRPSSNNLILEQVRQDAGAASSLLLFTFFLLGAGAMQIASLSWESRQAALGVMGVLSGTVSLVGWLVVRKRFALRRE